MIRWEPHRNDLSMEPPPTHAWKIFARRWLAGPNLPYLCLLLICVLSLVSRLVLLWR